MLGIRGDLLTGLAVHQLRKKSPAVKRAMVLYVLCDRHRASHDRVHDPLAAQVRAAGGLSDSENLQISLRC
jgi:hypothetical protein